MTEPTILDPAQLIRIEAVHRGFLYQHLIGTSCIFVVARGIYDGLTTEHDEDLELWTGAARLYMQVKHLDHPLRPNDIAAAIKRFEQLRRLHAKAKRNGKAHFIVVSSSEPSPRLNKLLAAKGWPADIEIVTPTRKSALLPIGIKANIAEQFAENVREAGEVRFTRVVPDTLAWKLAAVVQSLAAGTGAEAAPHSITRDLLPGLLEQIGVATDQLPDAPTPYRPQVDEPQILSDAPIRFIVGVSGAGKTSWAADAALHTSGRLVYARALETKGGDFPSWVASHIANAILENNGTARADAFRPGIMGIESLRVVDNYVGGAESSVVVIIDDAHQVDGAALLASVRATKHVRWLMLGHVSETLDRAASILGVKLEELRGWPEHTIAAVMHERGVIVTTQSAQTTMRITGGAPLLVSNIADLVSREPGRDLGDFLDKLESGTHSERTILEQVVLTDVISALAQSSRLLLGALSYFRASLSWDVVLRIGVEAFGMHERDAAAAARSLSEWRVLRKTGSGAVYIHDLYRTAGADEYAKLPTDAKERIHLTLKPVLEGLIRRHEGTMDHILDYLQVLAELGEVAAVAEVATGLEEWWREHGLSQNIESIIKKVYANPGGSVSDRFYLADSLSFFRLQRGDEKGAVEWIGRLEELAGLMVVLTSEFAGRIAVKKLLLAKLRNDFDGARSSYRDGLKWLDPHSTGARVFRYNFAIAAYDARRMDVAESEAIALMDEYLEVLGLTQNNVFASDVQEIALRVSTHSQDPTGDAHRLADCLYLIGLARASTNGPSALPFMWALKFYDIAQSPASLLRTAIEVVDVMLWNLASPEQAITLLSESILPAVARYGLVAYVPDLQSMYAVALACGRRCREAMAIVDQLTPYTDGMLAQGQAALRRREDIVRGLCSGSLRYEQGILFDRQGNRAMTTPAFPETDGQESG